MVDGSVSCGGGVGANALGDSRREPGAMVEPLGRIREPPDKSEDGEKWQITKSRSQ